MLLRHLFLHKQLWELQELNLMTLPYKTTKPYMHHIANEAKNKTECLLKKGSLKLNNLQINNYQNLVTSISKIWIWDVTPQYH